MTLVDEAVRDGARQERAAEMLGLTGRTLQRWREQGAQGGEDRRRGPTTEPGNKLSAAERQGVLSTVNAPAYRDLSPKQIVPQMADQGRYLASESTVYRILRDEGQMTHRQGSRPPTGKRPQEHVASGPNQVWSWDITYLSTAVRGQFFYLYLLLDVWSRKIMGGAVYAEECNEHAAHLFVRTCLRHALDPNGLVLHSDNGGPMKGSTMLATLQHLGVVPSFSRPRVSDDNPFSEALFRTLKYRPDYPSGPFPSLGAANRWVEQFIHWYNTEHRHSAIRYVTPEQRHSGQEHRILEQRRRVYEAARKRNPQRWSGTTRDWTPIAEVRLNPGRTQATKREAA